MSPLTLTRIARGFATAIHHPLRKDPVVTGSFQGNEIRTAFPERLELGHDGFGLLVQTELERREEVRAVEEVHGEVRAEGKRAVSGKRSLHGNVNRHLLGSLMSWR